MARYLSRAELSCIAGKYIEMYYALFGISKNDPAPINPEQFANSVLGLNLKMLPAMHESSARDKYLAIMKPYLLMWHSRLPRTTCPFQAKDSASARKSGR